MAGVSLSEEKFYRWARESFSRHCEHVGGEGEDGREWSREVIKGHRMKCALAEILGHVPPKVELQSFCSRRCANGKVDPCLDGMTLDTFVEGVMEILRAQTTEERIRLAFNACDVKGEGCISKSACVTLLKESFLQGLSDLDVLVEETINEIDTNSDGFISWSEFDTATRYH